MFCVDLIAAYVMIPCGINLEEVETQRNADVCKLGGVDRLFVEYLLNGAGSNANLVRKPGVCTSLPAQFFPDTGANVRLFVVGHNRILSCLCLCC